MYLAAVAAVVVVVEILRHSDDEIVVGVGPASVAEARVVEGRL